MRTIQILGGSILGRCVQITALLVLASCGRDAKDVTREEVLALPGLELPRSTVAGYWHEVARIPCDGGPEFVPEDPIAEMYFSFDGVSAGVITLTWEPFETYQDFHGDYQLDLETKTMALSNVEGNYVPPDLQTSGQYEIIDEQLVLKMWLGTSSVAKTPRACGHRFR
jgi:hypothetical protein